MYFLEAYPEWIEVFLDKSEPTIFAMVNQLYGAVYEFVDELFDHLWFPVLADWMPND